jgi:hypothetical protein
MVINQSLHVREVLITSVMISEQFHINCRVLVQPVSDHAIAMCSFFFVFFFASWE